MTRNIYRNLLNCEDNYTDAMINLVSIESFRNLFLKRLDIKGLKNIDPESIISRYDGKNFGKPDIFFEGDDIVFAFEVKINNYRVLTDNQPEGYLDLLKESSCKNKYLFLLIPVGYVFLEDFKERHKKWGLKNKNYDIKLKVIYWQDVIEDIRKLKNCDFVVTQFAAETADGMEYSNMSYTLNENEINMLESKDIIVFRKKIKGIIEYVRCEIKKLGYVTEKDKENEELNYMIKDKDHNDLLWFGSWGPIWHDEGYAVVVGCNFAHNKIENFAQCTQYKDQKYDPLIAKDINGEPSKILLEKVLKYLK